ncbi:MULTISPECIES: hypothetical protein [Streptomyces]|uniref:hypothetical protein n=1 Tax=Streptomyces TaxID=1883 RepID=UPI001489672C|nr:MULTISPECIES: hypothetical protein [Streptomyces]
MNIAMPRIRLTTAVVAATVAAGMLTVSAQPASANVSEGYVKGAYMYQDDFGDEGTLSTGSHAHTNATALWQWILWAEGAKKSNGDAFAHGDIDCWFGSDTKSATISLQRTLKLKSIDGIVGNETFGAVDGNIEWVSSNNDSYPYRTKLRYKGNEHAFFLYRSASGVYKVYIPNVGWKPASYTYANC